MDKKFTKREIKYIRSGKSTNVKLAEKYGCSPTLIADIKHRRIYNENPNRKLCKRQVDNILKSGKGPKELSRKYNVSTSTISNILNGHTYDRVKSEFKLNPGAPQKVDQTQIKEAAELYRTGNYTFKALAEKYGVGQNTLWRRVNDLYEEERNVRA